jgi:hypothetical protein
MAIFNSYYVKLPEGIFKSALGLSINHHHQDFEWSWVQQCVTVFFYTLSFVRIRGHRESHFIRFLAVDSRFLRHYHLDLFHFRLVAGVTLGKWKKPQRSSSHRNSTSNKHEKTTSQSEPQFRLRKQFIYYCSDTCTVDVQIEHWCRRENAFWRIGIAL